MEPMLAQEFAARRGLTLHKQLNNLYRHIHASNLSTQSS
jgi:hypothetical protein